MTSRHRWNRENKNRVLITRRPVGNRSAHPGTHRIRSDLRKNFGKAKRNILHLIMIRSDHSDGGLRK